MLPERHRKSGTAAADYASRLDLGQGQYQASKQAYINRGVPANKLFVTEHFANNDATFTTTRDTQIPAGAAPASRRPSDWDQVIMIRQDAIFNVGFDGFLAYNWGGNGMGVTQAEQIQHEYYYRIAPRAGQPEAAVAFRHRDQRQRHGHPAELEPTAELARRRAQRHRRRRELLAHQHRRSHHHARRQQNRRHAHVRQPVQLHDQPRHRRKSHLQQLGSRRDAHLQPGQPHDRRGVQLTSSLSAAINAGTFTISGSVSGAGGLTKTGAGTLALNGPANSYTGNTTVQAGTLRIASRSFADAADVFLSTGATLN